MPGMSNLFDSLRHVRNLIAAWRTGCNHHRARTSLTGLSREKYASRSMNDQNLNWANPNEQTQWGAGQTASLH